MTAKTPIILFALIVICTWPQPAIHAGSPTPDTASTATVTGVVKFEGKTPAPKAISMAADPRCAKQHHAPVFSQDLVTDTKGDVQYAVVFVADGLGDRTFDQPAQPVVIDQKGCMYEPHVVAMQANQPLEVVNQDPTSHNIHPVPANNREWNKAEPPGSKAEETFSRPEIAIPLRCNIHPWMHGYIAVFKNPYFAVTKPDGSFDLHGLPPGTYVIKAWQEKLGTTTQTITVSANETKTVDFVFKSHP